MFSIEHLIYLISILFNFLLAVFVFLQGRKEKINQTFFATVISANGWLISLFLYYNIESPEYILWLGRINFAMVLPLLYYLLKFAVIFPREIIPISKKIKVILPWWLFVMIILTLFTPFVAKEEIIVGPGQRETTYGFLYPVYVISYFLFSFAVIALLFYKIRKFEKRTEKLQIKYVLIGLALSLVFASATNIVFPLFGLFDIANYGPLATIIFSTFVTTAIVRHHLFAIKVILVEFFVAIIALILFSQSLMAGALGVKALNWTVFVLFCIFGYFLIKATLEEIKRREEMEKISKDLKIAYKELEKLDVTKSEFISIASHQLRTPLTAIKGYISMIKEKVYGIFPEKMEKPLDNIYTSTERLIKLVNDLLNISRIEAGKMEIKFEKLSLEEIITSIIEELNSIAQEKNVYLKWEKPKEPLPKILLDKEKIRQAILNIIDNGIRYTSRGGVTIRTQIQNAKCQIQVKDTGEGMNEKEISHLFKSFTRGSAGQRFWTEGAGLGLYIASGLVEMHKGKIWAESKGKGKGSTFYIELPMK